MYTATFYNRGVALLSLGLISAGCIGSTGGALVSFPAAAHGITRAGAESHPDGNHTTDPLEFDTQSGWSVALTRASVAIGAIYLSAARPLQNVRESACYSPALYVGEVRSARVVDLLDPTPQPFPALGDGIADRALSGEVWLGSTAAVDADTDKTVVLSVAGTARKNGVSIPFKGDFTISSNRKKAPQSEAQPGSNPLCQQRIIAPIFVDFPVTNAGPGNGLDLEIDARSFFQAVAFDELPAPLAAGEPRLFIDREEGQPSTSLYQGLRANRGPWTFRFRP
jgi:hypothetical protein